MGTTIAHRARGEMTDRQFFEREFGRDFPVCGTKGGAFFAAVDGMCIVIKCEWQGNAEFAYKDMDETMFPYYFDVPKKVWAALKPLPDDPKYDGARKWRALVEKQWVSYPKGTKLRTERPVTFKALPAGTHDFTVWDWKKKYFFCDATQGLVCIKHILDYGMSVLNG